MTITIPPTLREFLLSKDQDLADIANNLWRVSRPIHECQNQPDSNENGPLHVKTVENNIWRLLQTTTRQNKANNLEDFIPFELFILSCAACCHDFDKAMKSTLPAGFKHGAGSGEFVINNADALGLTRPQSRAVQMAVSIHDLKHEDFLEQLKSLKTDQASPFGPYNLRRVAVLLKAADILHCDNSRIPSLRIDPEKLERVDRKKYFFRFFTNGWHTDGSRILIQADPGTKEGFDAVAECFEYMKNSEWHALADVLSQHHFPHQLKLDQNEARLLEEYLKLVVTENKYIDIKGIFSRSGAGRKAINFPIEDIYTPLKTHPHMAGVDGSPGTKTRTHASETEVFLTDLLSENNRLLIVGEPGGGKTTFLKLIACVLAKDGLGAEDPGRQKHLGLSLETPAPIPVYLRLSGLIHVMKNECSDTGCGASWHWISRALERIHGPAITEMVEKLLLEGRCALLLDGLDEVADEAMRNRITEVVNSAFARWGKNLIVLTSRPFGYHEVAGLENMTTAIIDAFGETEIIEFLRRWGKALFPESEEQTDAGYLTDLKRAILDSPAIRKLAKNPVMLTCLCIVHWNERKLPEGKADLLAAVLRWLLNSKEEKRKTRGYDSGFAEECFKALAFFMTTHPQGKQVIVDIAWAADQLAVPFSDMRGIDGRDRVQRKGKEFFEHEMLDSGIVEKYGVGQLKFWHLNFQEHFAARSLVDRSDEEWWEIIEPQLVNRQWTEVFDHLAGCLAGTGRFRLDLLVKKIIKTAKEDDLASIAKAVGVLGRILRILEVYGYYPPPRLGWQEARDNAMAIFSIEGAARVAVEQRIAAAEALGQAGDPRIDPYNPEMLSIPGMSGVLLGKYPVTVMEFMRFVDNKGYEESRFWEEGWEVREEKGWNEPEYWEEQMEHPNRPVTGISWFEATAYCCWLSEQTGRQYRLPKGKEWEKAATHSDGEYPWGAEKPDAERCNFEGNVGSPTPVGIYPVGAAPNGHLDMAGNVWEWNRGVRRLIRGGGWRGGADDCRSAIRYDGPPDYRNVGLGFRLSRSVVLGT